MSNFTDELKVNLKEIQLTQEQVRRAYEKYIEQKQKQFVSFINYLNTYINAYREKGVISPFLKFYARIKTTDSALKNYSIKDLDDVFGIEFICSTEQEIETVQQALQSILRVHKVKKHDKENGYKAIHHTCSIIKEKEEEFKQQLGETKDNRFPIMEIQYKTIQVYWEAISGRASHEKYKNTQVPKIQALYDNDQLKVGEDIPHMWISNADTNNMRELSTEEILRKMYPSLNLDRNREKMQEESDNVKKGIDKDEI